jgi:PAS domain-containing protein
MFCAVQETTARVLAERRLAEETERQRRMFEQAPGFICTLRGPDHVFDFVNDTYKRLFGARSYVGTPVRKAVALEAARRGGLEVKGGYNVVPLDRRYS